MARTDPQTSLRLPQDLLDRLRAAADARGNGLGFEIVNRLQNSLADDDETSALQFEIGLAASLLSEHWIAWHADAEAWAVFKAAVNYLLDKLKPEKSGTPKSKDAQIMFEGKDAGERLALSVFWRGS